MVIEEINKEKIYGLLEEFSGAEIKAVCTEAGYFAIREDRTSVNEQDFIKAIDKINEEDGQDSQDYMNMFG